MEPGRDIILSLRAMVNSGKQPANLRELLKDYRELQGSNINYQKFGFQRIEDFLQASGEFRITYGRPGEVWVTVKLREESKHITNLVARQRTARKKTSSRSMSQPRRPRNRDNNNWNRSSSAIFNINNMGSSFDSRAYSRFEASATRSHHDGNNNSNKFPGRSSQTLVTARIPFTAEPPSLMSLKIEPPSLMSLKIEPPKHLPDLRHRLIEKAQNKILNSSRVRPILGQNHLASDKLITIYPQISSAPTVEKSAQLSTLPNEKINGLENRFVSAKIHVKEDLVKKDSISKIVEIIDLTKSDETLPQITPVSKPESYFSQNSSISSVGGEQVKRSVQDRLKRAQRQVSSETTIPQFGQVKATKAEKQEQKLMKVSPSAVHEFNPNLHPVVSIANYCAVNKYAEPSYEFLRYSKTSARLQCRVFINKVLYSTYPEDFDSYEEAQIAAAQVAINEIRQKEKLSHYPLCLDSEKQLADKIFDVIVKHPYGVFARNLPELFQQCYEQTIPDNWFSIIESNPQLFLPPEHTNFLDKSLANQIVLFAKTIMSSSDSTFNISEADSVVLDELQLPWEDKHWDIYVLNPISTVEIWARIVGPEYSVKLDSLLTDIEMAMLVPKNKIRPISITVGQIYLVCVADCWNRVHVQEIDKVVSECVCFFIDSGDVETLPMIQLHVCDPRFMKLPPQAILISLFGLEDFAENPSAKRHLTELLAAKTLVADVLTKKEEYEQLEAESWAAVKIQVVLYDTVSDDDIILNELLVNKICDDTPMPALKGNGIITNVNVTHITEDGDIFLQIRSIGLAYVQKLLNQLVTSKFKQDQHKLTAHSKIERDELVLIHDPNDGKWYRGAVVEKIGSDEFRMEYVDYGKEMIVNISNISYLTKLSTALSKYPKQAFRVRLRDVPTISKNKNLLARLRGFFPSDAPALVKLIVCSTIPEVIIYKRLEIDQCLCNVNEALRIEEEIESGDKTPSSDAISTKFTKVFLKNGRLSNRKNTNNSGMTPDELMGVGRTSYAISVLPKSGALPKIPSNNFIPEINEYFDVKVTMASNPSNFVVQPCSESMKLDELMKELQEYCQNTNEFIPADMIEAGEAYAALHSDGSYYRVIVEHIFGSAMFHVSYCDYGDVAVISNEKLKILPAKFRTLPKLAIIAKLHGIKPKYVDWTLEDCMRFRELTVQKSFASIVKAIYKETVYPYQQFVELILCDVQTDVDIYIHEIFVSAGHAVPV